MASQDVDVADGTRPPKRRRPSLQARQSSRNTQDILLDAARSGWGPTLRYGLLLLIHRGPLPVMGLVAYHVARSKGWL